MARHPSQVIVQVSIVGVDEHSQVFYSYTDPFTGQNHVNADSCKIVAVAPFHTLFALDYPSTRNGWGVEGLSAKYGTPEMPHKITEHRMALVTFDEGDNIDYRFEIHFKNRHTGDCIPDDPQEANIVQPK